MVAQLVEEGAKKRAKLHHLVTRCGSHPHVHKGRPARCRRMVQPVEFTPPPRGSHGQNPRAQRRCTKSHGNFGQQAVGCRLRSQRVPGFERLLDGRHQRTQVCRVGDRNGSDPVAFPIDSLLTACQTIVVGERHDFPLAVAGTARPLSRLIGETLPGQAGVCKRERDGGRGQIRRTGLSAGRGLADWTTQRLGNRATGYGPGIRLPSRYLAGSLCAQALPEVFEEGLRLGVRGG